MKTIIRVLILLVAMTVSAQAADFTLSWEAPKTNADGSPLTDLAGYRVYTVNDGYLKFGDDILAGTETATGTIAPGEHCFVVTAYDLTGNESEYSDQACIDVLGPSKVIKLIITVTGSD